jgi:hypothetical protein
VAVGDHTYFKETIKVYKTMKLPKKISICGVDYDVVQDKKINGGKFDCGTYKIKIGIRYPKDVPNIFLHEIIEAIITERGQRWRMWSDTNEKLLFSFNHAEFVNIVMDIAAALKGVDFKEEK